MLLWVTCWNLEIFWQRELLLDIWPFLDSRWSHRRGRRSPRILTGMHAPHPAGAWAGSGTGTGLARARGAAATSAAPWGHGMHGLLLDPRLWLGSSLPYFHLNPVLQSVGNLQKNPHATLTMSVAQTNFYRKHGFDPQSPLCAHTILTGIVTKVNEMEMVFAKGSLFFQHPDLKTWPSNHHWFFLLCWI